jgi:predicted dehydrogenase
MGIEKVKVGIIGMGDRGISFIYNFREFSDIAEIAGVYDRNRPRLEAVARHHNFTEVPRHDTWESFVAGSSYDLVLVTTPDDTHPEVVCRCLKQGYDIFCDKPLSNTPEGLVQIMKTYDQTKRMFLMGFNVRYHNQSRKMKQIAQRGELGDIKVGVCVHPEHGIRYFRRWHKFREHSVGLVIHKGCHQLDIMNWIIGSYPVEVYAQGETAVFKGDKKVEGCHVCADLVECPHARRLGYKGARQIYESYIGPSELDGYHRNYCPIAPDVSVPDFYIVTVRYANGARASYQEIHFAGRSRAHYSFFGDKGEMSAPAFDGSQGIARIDRLSGEKVNYEIPPAQGGHGGADPAMTLTMINSVIQGKSLMPPPEAGVRSSIIGIAAMRSIAENRPVRVEELVPMEYLSRCPDPGVHDDASMEAYGYRLGAETTAG